MSSSNTLNLTVSHEEASDVNYRIVGISRTIRLKLARRETLARAGAMAFQRPKFKSRTNAHQYYTVKN
ncbi:hypothetical protein QP173_02135 [Aerococcus urinae]|uniref:hypothetical protein n=1 Tax=Aerococcus TaxID=1375 RepID=UPI0018A7BA80|nr:MULTISPECIES: hypothetical protein [Aerococcus]MCY3036171.1 hypothetical protein [Aerococcus sp. Group 2]MDK6520185.1 hypothetical protein [Aerococcus urinae]